MDIDTDYIDNNYAWQRRIQTVFKNHKSSAPFPHAVALGVEFNPAFERSEKISVDLLTNGVVLDVNDFAKSVSKSACLYLLDILDFNFDLGLDMDRRQRYVYAMKVYTLAKVFKNRFKTNPQQLQAKAQDVFSLPDATVEKTDSPVEKSEQKIPLDLQLNNERKGDPILRKKYGTHIRNVQLSMDYYPLCKTGGVAFVLRHSNAPAQKLNVTLLTTGMVLEMLDFASTLSGSYSTMLKELISHNFGEVYEPCYLSGQLNALSEKKISQPTRELRESFCEEPFTFMLRKVTQAERGHKRPGHFDNVVEVVRENAQLEDAPSNAEDEINDYMCPMEFEPEFQANSEERGEDVLVDVESEVPEGVPLREKLHDEVTRRKKRKLFYFGFKHMRNRRNVIPGIPFPEIFSEDTLPMDLKTTKQKEWTRRTHRIKEIFNKPLPDMFSRSIEIGLDYNVGSGRKQNLDMNLLTNHTLFEVNRFCSHLSKSVTVMLIEIFENNFKLCFRDEVHERNLLSYVRGKEKTLWNHAHDHTFMSAPVAFPFGYNNSDVTGEPEGRPRSDDETEEEISDEFPYSKDINLNLWSLEERPFSRKLDLAALTHGALLEILTFTRKLCSDTRYLFDDILEHNFDVDLQDPASEDSVGLEKWFSMNRLVVKRALCTLKQTLWITEVISLKQYAKPKIQALISETAAPVVALKVEEYTYDICERIGLDLYVNRNAPPKPKLDMNLLTRGALFEVHNFVKTKCNRYVPALYEILDYNFDLSSQRHRRVELAWSIAAQVLAMVRKGERKGRYMRQVFELPFESEEGESCKEEPRETEIGEAEANGDELVFVQKLIPVDICVEIE